jgi:hypothetical protein
MFSMDPAIELDDCSGCIIDNNYIEFVRMGIFINGNSYATVSNDQTIEAGVLTYTPLTGLTYGVYAQASTRYVCTGGTGQACTGGRITNTLITSPQGFSTAGSTYEQMGVAAEMINTVGFVGTNNCFCDFTGPQSIYLGNITAVQLIGNTISIANSTGDAILIAAPTSSPAVGEAVDNGWWIDRNSINTDNNSHDTANGIVLATGAFPLVDLDLMGNQFFGFATGIILDALLTQSRIINNYGDDNTNGLIVLNATGGTSFAQTVIHDNTSRDSLPILIDTAGSGYILGYNQSPTQLTGTETVVQAGCTISAGAVGNTCNNAITFSTAGGQAQTNTTYRTLCTAAGGSGLWTVGNANTPTTTTVIVPSVALSASATGGGTIACTVTSVQ